MERDKAQKRKRDDDDEIINESKRQEYCINKPLGHQFCDEIDGVFDFPWLKEGVVFKGGDDYLDGQELNFSPLDEAPGTPPPNFEQSCSLNLCVSPTTDANFYGTKLDDDGFWSLLVDPPEPVDCIWNCVIDQPLDMGFYKGL